MMDFLHMGSSLSLRAFARHGSAMALQGAARFGSALSVLDYVHLGPRGVRARRCTSLKTPLI